MAFEKADTLEKVVAIVAGKLKVDKSTISGSSSFESLGADSLDMVEIIMKLEEQFGVEIKDEDADHITSVQDAVNALHEVRTR